MPNNPSSETPIIVYPNKSNYLETEISLYDLWCTIWKARKLIIGIVSLCLIVSIAYVSLTPKIYNATATIQLEEDSEINPFNFINLLNSSLLKERIINKLNLIPKISQNTSQESITVVEAASYLKNLVTIENNRELITIDVKWPENSQLPAEIANTYLAEIPSYLKNIKHGDLKNEQLYLENELKKVEMKIQKLTLNFNKMSQTFLIKKKKVNFNKVISQLNQLQLNMVQLNMDLIAKNLTLEKLEKKKLLKKISSETLILKKKKLLKKIDDETLILQEKINDYWNHKRNPEIAIKDDYTKESIQYFYLENEINVQQEIYKNLSFKLAELKSKNNQNTNYFNIIDSAIPSKKFIKPRIMLIVPLTFIISLILSLILVIFLDELKKIKLTHKVKENVS